MGCLFSKPGSRSPPASPPPEPDPKPPPVPGAVAGTPAYTAVEVEELSIEKMKRAMGKFSMSALIGNGPAGGVYKGTLGGRDVAVKKLTSNSQTEVDFLEEVELVKQVRHENVVQLLAFCPEEGHRALAFEYAPLGSLFDLLHGRRVPLPAGCEALTGPLRWEQRLRIVQGAAQGLEYLHNNLGGSGAEGLVHKRIKSNNILVFEGYVGKIADCKLQPQYQDSILLDSSLPLGNFACEAPELSRGELTQKSDVYSFGIVLLEVLSGRKSMQGVGTGSSGAAGQQQTIREWALGHISSNPKNLRQIVDPNIEASELSDAVLQRFCKLARYCLESEPGSRPEMKVVLKTLQRL